MTDAEIIQAVLAGNRGQFGELVRRYQAKVYGLAWHLLGHHAEAEDAAQEAFITAYARLGTLAQPEKFAGWLRRIATNLCRMRQRRQRPAVSWEDISPATLAGGASPATLAERAELRRRVHQAIAGLPESQRLPVLLFYMDGMSHEEVGRFLGIPASAIKGRLHRARAQLKEALMDTIEDVMREQRPGKAFTESVQRAVARLVEPFDYALPITPSDVVLIYTHEASVHIHGGDGDQIQVKGHKILFGSSVDEARGRSEQVAVAVDRRQDVWTGAPYGGEHWAGVQGRPPAPRYNDSGWEWEHWKNRWVQEETLGGVLPGLLSGEVVAVIAGGRRIEGIRVPYPLEGDAQRDFRANFVDGRQGLALGPAASVVLDVTIPPCRHVLLIGAREATACDLQASLFVTNQWGSFAAERIQGNVFLYEVAPEHLVAVTGDVWLHDPIDHRGVEWTKQQVRRVGNPPAVTVRRVGGAVRIRSRCLDLDMAGIRGDLAVENDFGATRWQLNNTWPPGRTADLGSVSGPITVTLTPAADERLRVSIRTECGAIDRSQWPTGSYCYNTPASIYLSTKHESAGADVRIRTRSGDVGIARKS